MWPLWFVIKRYAPYVTFPVALVVGFVGYNIESLILQTEVKDRPSDQEKRVERFLETQTRLDVEETTVYKTIFDRPTNVPPTKR